MKQKNTTLCIAAAMFLFLTMGVNAAPIEGSGNYKSHGYNAQGGLRIKCGWQWWHTCWGIDRGKVWVDDWDHIIGWVCYPNTDPNPGEQPSDEKLASNEYIYKNMDAGSLKNPEDDEMETWYTFSNIVFVPASK